MKSLCLTLLSTSIATVLFGLSGCVTGSHQSIIMDGKTVDLTQRELVLRGTVYRGHSPVRETTANVCVNITLNSGESLEEICRPVTTDRNGRFEVKEFITAELLKTISPHQSIVTWDQNPGTFMGTQSRIFTQNNKTGGSLTIMVDFDLPNTDSSILGKYGITPLAYLEQPRLKTLTSVSDRSQPTARSLMPSSSDKAVTNQEIGKSAQ